MSCIKSVAYAYHSLRKDKTEPKVFFHHIFLQMFTIAAPFELLTDGTVAAADSSTTQVNVSRVSLKHTASSDTIFVLIYMDPPPEVPGVSKDAPGSTKHAI